MKHKTLIAVDIGNTNITAGLFKSGHLVNKAKTLTHQYYLYGRFFNNLTRAAGLKIHDVEAITISSVVPLALARHVAHINQFMKSKVYIIGRDIKVPINNRYKMKSEVGQDRLVNAYAAKAKYGTPCVIVDFGTAITFDCVSKKGDYLGGLIPPGIEMSLSSLYKKTAMLPRVELNHADSIIGKDTVNSMRGGILFGFGAMCAGLAAQYRAILGKDLKVIATGGNASMIKKYAKSIKFVDEDLTLSGILLISNELF